jgi:hypothetical protein
MSNWFKKAQEVSPEGIQNPTEETGPQQIEVDQVVANDAQVQEIVTWFTKLKTANSYQEEAKKILTERLETLGVTQDNIPQEIKDLFAV